jgi:hypothetical protein
VTLRLTTNLASLYNQGAYFQGIVNRGVNEFSGAIGTNGSEYIRLRGVDDGGIVGVGIFNTNPSYNLDLTGTFRATGNSLIGGTFGVTGATAINNVLTINSGASNGLLLNGTSNQNIIVSTSSNLNSGIIFQNSTTGNNQATDGLSISYIGGANIVNREATKTFISTNNNSNQLVLDTDGNVGIGKDDATATLDVNGTLKVTDATTLSNTLTIGTTNTVAPTSILGKDNTGVVGGIVVGSGLTLSGSTLSLASSGGFVTTNSNYTVTITDSWIVFNNNFNNITVTLPNAATSTGRTLYFRNAAAGSIVSAGTANVINNTVTTGTPTNDILGAGNTSVKWCTLVSNGTYWIKIQGGSL